MSTETTTARNVTSEIALSRPALKAPSLAGAVERLAERARAEGWSREEFLAACLQREVAVWVSHSGEGWIQAARFPTRKSLEEFDFEHQRSPKRELQTELFKLDRIPLLIVDEVDYIPLRSGSREPAFPAVASRYERPSLIVTSNKPLRALRRGSADVRSRDGLCVTR